MRLALLAVLLSTVLAGCRPSQQQVDGSGLRIAIEMEGTTPRLGTTPLTVVLERDGAPVTGARVRISGDMTHAGMAPVLRDTVETAPGLYRAEDFEFTMAGDWFLTADVELADGRRFSEIRPISVGR